MSQVYRDYGSKYYIYAGTTKVMTSVIIDPSTSKAQDLTNSAIFASGYVDIVKADGTSIQSNIVVNFAVRTAGASQITWIAGPFTNNQAGNWIGYLKIQNIYGTIIDQQIFNFQILESY